MSWPYDREEEQDQAGAEVELLERPRRLEEGYQEAAELFQPQLDPQQLAHMRRSDEQLWQAVNHGGDVLQGLRFEDAVVQDPLRIEALIHQRIHDEFFAAMGIGAQQRRAAASMGVDMTPFGQMQAFLDRNQAYRQLHGPLTAQLIADSLHRNWEQFSALLTRMLFQAGANHPVGQAMLNFYVQNWDRLSRAFREAQEIAHRAARVCQELGRAEDITAWRSVAAAIRDMHEFVDKAIHAPRRPTGEGIVPMGAGHGQRYQPRQPQRRPIPEQRRLPAPAPAAVEGPQAQTIVQWSGRPATMVQSEDPDTGAVIWSYLGKNGTSEAIVTIDESLDASTIQLTWLGKDRGRPMAALVRCRLGWFLKRSVRGEISDRIAGLLQCSASFGDELVQGRSV
jgi:hypothetical protein